MKVDPLRDFSGELKRAGERIFEYQAFRDCVETIEEHAREYVHMYVCVCVCTCVFVLVGQYDKQFFWQYSSGSTPLTGMEAGLLTTTTSSSMCITVIGSEVTGTSCLQHTNRNQLNVALFRLRLHVSRTRT